MFEFFKARQPNTIPDADMLNKKNLVALIILDGFGVHPDAVGNAVLAAKTPFLDIAWTYGKSTLIHASGTHVGLPPEEAGNSEVGHLNIGAGSVVYQTLPRINDAIEAHELDKNEILMTMINTAKEKHTKVHLMGILSAAGVHGHVKHLYSILEICKANGIDPMLHIILDGRDAPPHDGYLYMDRLKQKIKELGIGHIASIQGRFYGMDRDNRWERTKVSYDAMVGLAEEAFEDPSEAIQKAYTSGEDDQFFKPRMCIKDGLPIGAIKDGDSILFWNYREDRARQITKAFVMKEFAHFNRRNYPKDIFFATMTGYEENLPAHVVFPPQPVKKSLAETLSTCGKTQFHISETEKQMHVTYFFNGGTEAPHNGEVFFTIPSPKVDDYAAVPAMSAEIIRDEVMSKIEDLKKVHYNFILINFANPDMVGHTGDYKATVQGNEIIDSCTGDITKGILAAGGTVIITADHGNCETMINRVTGEIDIAHTNNPVPLIILSSLKDIQPRAGYQTVKIGTGPKAKATGLLADIAPTCLSILGCDIPANMTGVDIRNML
ncbi:MAG: 2,3-bisphosphoglycerate-independent phosphoglycerate mutase [candidate division WS6 bacterium GW2011_GWC1_36_11]|uniref:2,3-bisphosphoglycerate-independent phosphoglycerate mutase n=3 Tax=Candidatus Dojkabacteria TaxID=74243 RepID=A0A0G0DMK2_9BACT|nr:MAG: 2,3-bisphosphoglycerate-independent phosphoglycerate mutase [candidate division WS6 bacterium GW2011_GWC1_36_11]KKQ04148.1 MAG: 2,3-bisphosphoglycerate-independent phosphoglycerate mutase [candidate division WS6 bacterium GW2011_WS6_36_26]KKQ12137.1 MAG: 2,3-bisphosphoglycerate-independent phosphoglycerate mutase [candidate division WS6 bacterium GW2011_GWC2_36_7]KKQ16899.1 MAG: 2,3-bisphosphoglycerate-independent phosphoglycerate mutase [candidate division WS6 bacterium GW2011_GWF1_36_8